MYISLARISYYSKSKIRSAFFFVEHNVFGNSVRLLKYNTKSNSRTPVIKVSKKILKASF